MAWSSKSTVLCDEGKSHWIRTITPKRKSTVVYKKIKIERWNFILFVVFFEFIDRHKLWLKDFCKIISKDHETEISEAQPRDIRVISSHCPRIGRILLSLVLWSVASFPYPYFTSLNDRQLPYLQHQHRRPAPRKSLDKGNAYNEVDFAGGTFADEHVWVCYWGGTYPAS
jgi:hypothetical protein